MTTQKVYADNFSTSFSGEKEFLLFLGQREENAAWETRHAKELRLLALESQTVNLEPDESQTMDDFKAMIEDTMENTRLLLKAKDRVYPVRSCAVKTLLDRAKISGNALKRLEKHVLARMLNYCLKVTSGDALLRIADGKVSAIHAGDRNDYAILELPELFKQTIDYLYSNFESCVFAGGSYDHKMATAVWELSGEDGLIKAYKDALILHSALFDELKPAIRLSSSDVGVSGANLYPTIFAGKRSGTITLGSPLRLEHKNGATIKSFEAQLRLLYAQYQLALGNLTNLLDIQVINPYNCLLGICKRIGISKKLAFEAAELFKNQRGDDPCTAHDVYYGINEVIFMLQCDGAPGSKVAAMEEIVARALSVRWGDYDMPGDFKW